jgi:5-methylcytosine-specific restriction endonuclease McrA
MIHVDSLAAIPDEDLFAGVERLVARSNAALADLLAHLGEVERRGIHRLRACASLYTYCMYELRMSEDAAYRRSKAARFVREYPELYDAIVKGELHLTGVLMIGPHLGGERHAEILRRARFRSKRELLRLIAEIDPKPGVPALVEPLGPAPAGRATHAAFVEAMAGPVRELPPGRRPEDWIGEEEETEANGDDSPRCTETAANVPDADEIRPPLHYKVQFTATQEFVDLLEEVRSLLGHERSGTDLPALQLRALRALVEELRRKKRAASDHPRKQIAFRDATDAPARDPRRATDATDAPARQPQPASDVTDTTDAPARRPERAIRHIPAPVRRAVFERDASRCAYRDDRGERCRETRGLEIHHRHAHALGGAPTFENLELRCRPHNVLAAEQDFGREHMDWMRGLAERTAPERAP